MSYPLKLVPQIYYRHINVDNLNQLDIFLIRSTLNRDIIDPNTQRLKADCVCSPVKNMDDLSLNFYGNYTENDINLEITDKKDLYFDNWVEWQCGERPQKEHFKLSDVRGWFYIKLSDIHKKRAGSVTAEAFSFTLECEVVHKPVKCNFWHTQLQWRNSNGQIVTRTDKGWSRPIQTTLRTFVLNLASTIKPQSEGVPFYLHLMPIPDKIQKAIISLR